MISEKLRAASVAVIDFIESDFHILARERPGAKGGDEKL
jgi:hypothetical protein